MQEQPYPSEVYQALTGPNVMAVFYDPMSTTIHTYYFDGAPTRYNIMLDQFFPFPEPIVEEDPFEREHMNLHDLY